MEERNKRVLVGMSGGIDSTATCLMLQEQGYEIVGVTMRVWGDEPQDARELAERMGIEHYVADERIPFKETIVKNFISYLSILINHNSSFSIITSPIPLLEAMKAPPSTRLPS